MEKIYFDETTFIWRKKLDYTKHKRYLIDKAKLIIKEKKNNVDAYSYPVKQIGSETDGDLLIKNTFDEILQNGVNICKQLYKDAGKPPYDRVNCESWVNMVRSKKPKQIQFKHNEIEGVDKFHIHTELSKNMGSFIPTYTFVYYIQMPDIMDAEDGVLYFKSKTGKEYFIRPEEDDLIILPADMPHAPNNAPNAKINRIVLAGNVGFDVIKKEKTIF